MNEANATVDRTTGIGGSDIGAICGISHFRTPFGVYCDKLGLADPQEQTDRMRIGKLLEPTVVKLYEAESGNKVIWLDQTRRLPQDPIVIGTPDGILAENRGRGVPAVIPTGFEAKTAGLDQAWRWGDDGDNVPQEYLVQCQWYMLLCGKPQWVLAVLIGGDRFKSFVLLADEELQGLLLERGRKFWRDHIERRDPPDIDASPAATSYLRRRYPSAVEPMREANLHERELMAAIKRHKDELKLLTTRSDALQNQLRDSIGAARGVFDPDSDRRATWTDVKESQVPAYVRKAYRSLTIRSPKEES
jgi:putative phage-type endonuclease